MIFITVGSREYPFDRLFEEIDRLKQQEIIKDTIFAQIGQTKYEPRNINYERFLSPKEFSKYQENSDIIISHGGTGSLISALKKRKKVIAVPRLEKYGEHIDDHQLQVSSVLEEEGYLLMVTDMSKLGDAILKLQNNSETVKAYDKPSYILDIINDYLQS